jgi:hypothetical protein
MLYLTASGSNLEKAKKEEEEEEDENKIGVRKPPHIRTGTKLRKSQSKYEHFVYKLYV